jgi:hypothetical protein
VLGTNSIYYSDDKGYRTHYFNTYRVRLSGCEGDPYDAQGKGRPYPPFTLTAWFNPHQGLLWVKPPPGH